MIPDVQNNVYLQINLNFMIQEGLFWAFET